MQSNLNEPAAVDLTQCASIDGMAIAEGWQSEDYALALATHLRSNEMPLTAQRERLQALAHVGASADLAAAETLSQHHQILESLFYRFAAESVKWLDSGARNANENSERFLNAAIKAQAAAGRCLSALKVLRESPTTPRILETN